jgi:hypothetical protein
MQINLENTEGAIKMDNPEKLATQGTQDDQKQNKKHSTKCVVFATKLYGRHHNLVERYFTLL